MLKPTLVLTGIGILGLTTILSKSADSSEFSGNAGMFEISITNITKGQILSPPIVATHNSNAGNVFELGEAASHELYQIAEDAVNTDMLTALSEDPNVLAVAEVFGLEGPILPGETASIEIAGGSGYNRISLAGMLVSTNDGFYGLNHERLTQSRNLTYLSPAYDAGSEFNNELCDYIPGPPCGNAGVRATDGAEGFIHVHSGIHGVGGLAPAEFDWRNSVAKITIRRIQ